MVQKSCQPVVYRILGIHPRWFYRRISEPTTVTTQSNALNTIKSDYYPEILQNYHTFVACLTPPYQQVWYPIDISPWKGQLLVTVLIKRPNLGIPPRWGASFNGCLGGALPWTTWRSGGGFRSECHGRGVGHGEVKASYLKVSVCFFVFFKYYNWWDCKAKKIKWIVVNFILLKKMFKMDTLKFEDE